MHHLAAEEVSSIWSFEQTRGFDAEPMHFKTLCHEFLSPHLQPRRDDWDNLASDLLYLNNTAVEARKSAEKAGEDVDENALKFEDWEIEKSVKKHWRLSSEEEVAFVNMESCEQACARMGDCMQWRYRTGLCIFDKVSLGRPGRNGADVRRSTSGWMVERIREWAYKEECHGRVTWPRP